MPELNKMKAVCHRICLPPFFPPAHPSAVGLRSSRSDFRLTTSSGCFARGHTENWTLNALPEPPWFELINPKTRCKCSKATAIGPVNSSLSALPPNRMWCHVIGATFLHHKDTWCGRTVVRRIGKETANTLRRLKIRRGSFFSLSRLQIETRATICALFYSIYKCEEKRVVFALRWIKQIEWRGAFESGAQMPAKIESMWNAWKTDSWGRRTHARMCRIRFYHISSTMRCRTLRCTVFGVMKFEEHCFICWTKNAWFSHVNICLSFVMS